VGRKKADFTDKLVSALVNEFAAEFEIFVLSTLEKYQQFSHLGPWSATFDPRELAFHKADKENLRLMPGINGNGRLESKQNMATN